ncbi:hypothetical protein BJX64DRAFT_206698 [Aspergillus heterothallicus]
MPTSFLDLPGELRNKIYDIALVRDEPIDPRYGCLNLVPTLLATNRTILHESRSFLYGENIFDLTASHPQLISEFLDEIGCSNAGHIRRLAINFPTLCDFDNNVRLADDSSSLLDTIGSACINMVMIMIPVDSTETLELTLDDLDSPKAAGEALALIDARFRKIQTLQEIVVEAYDEGPSDHNRRIMQGLGWVLKVVERVPESEEWYSDRDYLTDHDDDYYDDDDDDDDDDEYDIDNDSDFWRRAAD